MADTEQKAAPTPYVAPSDIDPEVLMKAFQEDGVVPEKPAEQQETTQEAAKKPEAAPSPAEQQEPALLRIAREKAKARQLEQANKPQNEALAVFSPQELERAAQARRAGDPVAALRALGFDHTQYTKALLNMKDEPEPQKDQPQVSPDVAALKAEVERLKQEREQERFQSTRAQMHVQMRDILKTDSKFTYVNALEAVEGVEQVLAEFFSAHGTMPGESLAESVKLAAEVYEAKLRSGEIPLTKKQWEKIQGLTAQPSSAPVPAKAPESQPSPGTGVPRTLTNSNTTAPAAVNHVPKSRAEILDMIARGEDIPEGL